MPEPFPEYVTYRQMKSWDPFLLQIVLQLKNIPGVTKAEAIRRARATCDICPLKSQSVLAGAAGNIVANCLFGVYADGQGRGSAVITIGFSGKSQFFFQYHPFLTSFCGVQLSPDLDADGQARLAELFPTG